MLGPAVLVGATAWLNRNAVSVGLMVCLWVLLCVLVVIVALDVSSAQRGLVSTVEDASETELGRRIVQSFKRCLFEYKAGASQIGVGYGACARMNLLPWTKWR